MIVGKGMIKYTCEHSLCGAHLLRDCVYVAEEEKEPWAAEMHTVLLELSEATKQARACGQKTLDPAIRMHWLTAYFEVIKRGYRAWNEAHPPPEPPTTRKRGRPKQDPGKNLLDMFLHRADEVLACVDDLAVPFTNKPSGARLAHDQGAAKDFRDLSQRCRCHCLPYHSQLFEHHAQARAFHARRPCCCLSRLPISHCLGSRVLSSYKISANALVCFRVKPGECSAFRCDCPGLSRTKFDVLKQRGYNNTITNLEEGC